MIIMENPKKYLYDLIEDIESFEKSVFFIEESKKLYIFGELFDLKIENYTEEQKKYYCINFGNKEYISLEIDTLLQITRKKIIKEIEVRRIRELIRPVDHHFINKFFYELTKEFKKMVRVGGIFSKNELEDYLKENYHHLKIEEVTKKEKTELLIELYWDVNPEIQGMIKKVNGIYFCIEKNNLSKHFRFNNVIIITKLEDWD